MDLSQAAAEVRVELARSSRTLLRGDSVRIEHSLDDLVVDAKLGGDRATWPALCVREPADLRFDFL
ncbi:MAG: hypothetical protein IPF92_15755 [Myxococcales bacterium]|nr:hypothetical protein [Myxococcales bacterium]